MYQLVLWFVVFYYLIYIVYSSIILIISLLSLIKRLYLFWFLGVSPPKFFHGCFYATAPRYI